MIFKSLDFFFFLPDGHHKHSEIPITRTHPRLPHRLLPSHLLDANLAGSMATGAWVGSKVPAGWHRLSSSPSPSCCNIGFLQWGQSALLVLTC